MNQRPKNGIKFVPGIVFVRGELMKNHIGEAPDQFKNKDGYFFNRFTKQTWVQYKGKCYQAGSPDHFNEVLNTCEGPKLNINVLNKLQELVADGIINSEDAHAMNLLTFELIARMRRKSKLNNMKWLKGWKPRLALKKRLAPSSPACGRAEP